MGYPVPDEARITLRRFEDPKAATREQQLIGALEPTRIDDYKPPETDQALPTICVSIGFWFCATIGDIVSPGGDPGPGPDETLGAGVRPATTKRDGRLDQRC